MTSAVDFVAGIKALVLVVGCVSLPCSCERRTSRPCPALDLRDGLGCLSSCWKRRRHLAYA